MTAVVREARVGVGVNTAGPTVAGGTSCAAGTRGVEVDGGRIRVGQAPVGWSSGARRCLLVDDLPSGHVAARVGRVTWVGSGVVADGRRASAGRGRSGVSDDGFDGVRVGVTGVDLSRLGARCEAVFDAVSSVALLVLMAISAVVVAVVVVGVMAGYIV